jgi:carbonic anhydrase
MKSHRQLLLANQAWAKEKIDLRPDYFQRSQSVQTPEFLWLGCSDSRVPAEEITGAEPGELFVHRNIANLVVHTDFNFLSVLQYAVEVLRVKHIIVCGHYGCGGIQTSLLHKDFGLINKWLRHIKDIYRFHETELSAIEDLAERRDRLVELNVLEQVHNIAETSIVQYSWRKEERPIIHGWVYDLKTGLLKELTSFQPGQSLENIYKFDFEPG